MSAWASPRCASPAANRCCAAAWSKWSDELARLRTLSGEPLDLALTTNGHLLESLAAPLKAAGLNRVTVSMDAVDAPTFERITRVPGSFQAVLAGIRAARAAGLTPLKINCVLLRGFNDDQIEGFARFAREEDVVVRFIEFMPLEEGRLWTPEIVVPLSEIVARINRASARCVPLPAARAQRDRPPLHLRRRRRRNRHHRARHARPFAEHAAACASPPTARSAPASFRRSNTISTAGCAPAQTTRNCAPTSLRTVQGKEARHHIGEPGFLKPSRSMVHIGG